MPESTTTPVQAEDRDGQPRQTPPEAPPAPGAAGAPLVEADLLVEDVSIDGMCGVY
jgi:mycofactocin precursor